MDKKIVEFIRKKDFKLLKQLGRGGCSKTYLLYDDIIDEKFVCKKYEPFYLSDKTTLFKNFVQEIKLLHLVYHINIVRVYNYFLYPDQFAGYILMEFVEGNDIEEYLKVHPQEINEVFVQTIEGFKHLENNNILHRDIRPQNILVRDDGVVKIIDFGFGKQARVETDFDKSISLNWWCSPPDEFKNKIYDFKTEVYFVGKLFDKIITDNNIEEFKYKEILAKMSEANPDYRIQTFPEINKDIQSNRFYEIDFEVHEIEDYRNFSKFLSMSISKIESNTKYIDNIDLIQNQLDDLYKRCRLEEDVPDKTKVIRCFLNGSYYHNSKLLFPVDVLKAFILLLRYSSKEKKNIILSNLQTKLDAINRYEENMWEKDSLPF